MTSSVSDQEPGPVTSETRAWQVMFDPGLPEDGVGRVVDFACAEGIADEDSDDGPPIGLDPQVQFIETIDRATAERHIGLFRRILEGTAPTATEKSLLAQHVATFDHWLDEVARPRAELYDADDPFFDFDGGDRL